MFSLGIAITGALNVGFAQTATFGSTQSNVPASTLTAPLGIAVDASGNLYIANRILGPLFKETPSSNGTYAESTIGSDFRSAEAIAIDTNGNLYIADTNNNRVVKETVSAGGYSESTIASGLSSPSGITVDGSGNVYIAENAYVLKETPAGDSYVETQLIGGYTFNGIAVDSAGNLYLSQYGNILKGTPSSGSIALSTIASGFGGAFGIAVDNNGIIYVADGDTAGKGRVLELIPASGTYTQNVLYIGPIGFSGIAIDWQKNLYVTNWYTNQVLKLATAGATFDSQAIGSRSSSISFTFTFSAGGTIAAPAVVTQGITGLDFVDAGTGTCTTNGTTYTYDAGTSCTVDVIFSPKAPGVRYGAVLLKNSSGSVIATGYAQGIGLGPQVAFTPGLQNPVLLPNSTSASALAVDAGGNLFIANAIVAYDPNNSVVKETWNGSSYTQTVVAAGFGYPTGVAVDGAGNVYVADQDYGIVYKETPLNGSYTQSIVDNTLGTVGGIAVDGTGNVYVGRGGIGVEKETLAGGNYVRSEILYTFYASAIGVDSGGALYIADGSSTGIRKETASKNGYIETTLVGGNDVYHLAVDGLGNVFFSNGRQLLKASLSNGSYTQSTIATAAETANVAGIAVDKSGNVWFSEYDYVARTGTVLKTDYADPPSLNFASTTYGSTSTDSPRTVTIQNAGNGILNFPLPTSGNNPSISSSFALNANTDSACPLVDAGSPTAGTLAAGASCEFLINFVPATVGAISGSLILTDDSLNLTAPNYATQSIQLSGTAVQAVSTVSWTNPAAITYGTPLSVSQLNATASTPGLFSYSPAAGTVLAVGQQTLRVTFTPSDTTDYTGATASVSLIVNKATPSVNLSSSAIAIVPGATVTFTASIASPVDSPTGTVTFFDGGTQLGTATLNGGIATYATSALTAGAHSITAEYSGDSNFTAATSTVVSVSIVSLTIGSGVGGSTSATASPGGRATYTLAFTPSGGTTFPADIQLSISGLPTGATAVFSPNPIPAGSGATNVTLTISLPTSAAVNVPDRPFGSGPFPLTLALLVLPFASRIRRARLDRRHPGTVLLGVLVVLAIASGLASCGGGSSPAPPRTYTLTVTATSGTLSQNIPLNLTVE